MGLTAKDLFMRELGQTIASSRLFWFNKHILAYPDINEHVHGPMCDFYEPCFDKEGNNDYAMDLEPRNTMKTTFTVVGGSIWILAKDPNARILILSSSHEEAKKRLATIKIKMENSVRLKFFYRDLARNKKSKQHWKAESVNVWGRTIIDLEPSIDTGGRGTDKTGNHYGGCGGKDANGNPSVGGILVDDIENEVTSQSEDERATTMRCIERLGPCMQTRYSILRITGTRWSYDDAYSRVLGEHPLDHGRFDFYRIRVKSSYNNDGSLYYPERLTEKYLANQRKQLGAYLFSCNFLNDPAEDKESPFPTAFTTYYTGEYVKEGTARFVNIEKAECPKMPGWKWTGKDKVQIRTFITVDPALSDKDAGCYSGVVICGQEIADNRLWIIDCLQIKSQDPYKIIDELIALYLRYEPLAIVIEDCVWQRALASFFEGETKKRGIYVRVETVGRSDHRSKHERILGLSNYWKSNAIFIPSYKPAVGNLLTELYHFPKSRTLDLADAFSRVLDIRYGIQNMSTAKNIRRIEEENLRKWKRLSPLSSLATIKLPV